MKQKNVDEWGPRNSSISNQRRSTQLIQQSIFSMQNSEEKNLFASTSSVKRIKYQQLNQDIKVAKINLNQKRGSTLSLGDFKKTFRRNPSVSKISERTFNKSVSMTPRGTVPSVRASSRQKNEIQQICQRVKSPPLAQRSISKDDPMFRQKKVLNDTNKHRTSLDYGRQNLEQNQKFEDTKTDTLKNIIKKQKPKMVRPLIQNQPRPSLAQEKSPKRLTKQKHIYSELKRPNTKFQSQHVTNMNLLSEAMTKNQCSVVNLELEHLEKGELLVKISSGTSSRGSNCDDVDELSDVVQSDVLSQNLNTKSMFHISKMSQKTIKSQQNSASKQFQNQRQPPESLKFSRQKSPIQYSDYQRQFYIQSSIGSNVEIPDFYVRIPQNMQTDFEVGNQGESESVNGGRAKTSEQANPTDSKSRLSNLSSRNSQHNNIENVTIESKKDSLKESVVGHVAKMKQKKQITKSKVNYFMNLQQLLQTDKNSRQHIGNKFTTAAKNGNKFQPASFSPQVKNQPKLAAKVIASKCSCPKIMFEHRFSICHTAIQWLKLVEERTDIQFDYERSKQMYDRVQNKKQVIDDKQIAVDVKRTFAQEQYFKTEEGKTVLTRLLSTISKHSSSAGYTQGMNSITGSLLFHSEEVIAFELTLRALNDYHVKEVHMPKLPGFYHHCEVIDALIDKNLPTLHSHFKTCQVKLVMFGQNWIMTLFTQVIPLDLIMRFWTLFWREEWIIIYRLILLILMQMKKQIMQENNAMAIQQVIYKSYALRNATNVLTAEEHRQNYKYWLQQIELLESGFNGYVDQQYIISTARQFQIY